MASRQRPHVQLSIMGARADAEVIHHTLKIGETLTQTLANMLTRKKLIKSIYSQLSTG